MANIPVSFFLQFLLMVSVQATQPKQSNHISFGSSLFANSHPTPWQSPSRVFAFGFYQQGNGFMVGIWLASKPNNTVVWTANRGDAPVSSDSKIEFTIEGRLVLSNNQGVKKNLLADLSEPATYASMLDSGNFVIHNRNSVIWQSFDHPTDTILGDQNLTRGQRLESSASKLDSSSGRFYLIMQSDGNVIAYPSNSSGGEYDSYWSIATFGESVWLNLNSKGYLCLRESQSTCLKVIAVASSVYPANNQIMIYRATLNSDGNFRLYSHRFNTIDNSSVSIDWSALQNQCEAKGFCGVNSYCSSIREVAGCVCFPGFAFVDPEMKFLGCYRDFIDDEGCKVRDPTGLTLAYNFTALENTELRGYPYSLVSITTEEYCAQSCMEDCNCWGALHKNLTCSKYKLPLKYGILSTDRSAMTFIKLRFPKPPISGNQTVGDKSKKHLVLALALSLGFLAFFCSSVAVYSFFFYRSRAHRYQKFSANANLELTGYYSLRSFTYNELEKATDGFKEELGRNQFGALYKGEISGGQIVTVKRLERVVEGERGFRAEMTAIGQTHHRNLVRLLGFCIEGARKLLVYEFLNNGSLADLLFKVDRRPKWSERVRIALDVARGILYLHEECKIRIIHCNIKPQNILMDDSWTAKISDFGLAKLLMPNQSGTRTGVRGTGGYMAPEWHKNMLISEKVDVYSFGVVLLEILCCRRNMEVNVSTADEVTLSTWVYDCFMAKDLKKLIGDEEHVDMKTLERMVKVGLLCIQDNPNLRPAMKSVILMLEGTMCVPVPPSPTPLLVVT